MEPGSASGATRGSAPLGLQLVMVCILLAVGFTASRLLVADAHEAPGPAGGDAMSVQAQRLETALQELTARVERLETAPITAPATSVPGSRTETGAPSTELQRAIDELRARVERIEKAAAAAPRAANPGPVQPTPEELAARRAELRRRAFDPNESEESRWRSLNSLINRSSRAEPDLIQEALRIAQTSQDARTRADVWRNMHGVKNDSLVQPLLLALANDADRNVREEAAETLEDFADRHEVRAALEAAKANDADLGVRRQAEQSLARRR
jgi:hypothetical protein